VDKDEHCTLLGRESGEAPLELVLKGYLALGVARRRLVGGCQADLGQSPAPVASYPLEAGSYEELSEPGLESVGITEARE
jgi:hypothetical protein